MKLVQDAAEANTVLLSLRGNWDDLDGVDG